MAFIKSITPVMLATVLTLSACGGGRTIYDNNVEDKSKTKRSLRN